MEKVNDNKRLIIILAIVAAVAIIFSIIVTILLLNRGKDGISRFDWIDELCEIADINGFETDEPFYDDVDRDDNLFMVIQAAVEADVIPITDKFKGDKHVTGEFAVVTALRAVDEYKRTRLYDVEDKSDDDYLEYALENGLIEKAELNKELSEERCNEILEKTRVLIYGRQQSANAEKSDFVDMSDEKISGSTNDSFEQEDENEETAFSGDYMGISLDQHYTTKYGQVNDVIWPTFSFDYPSNWKVMGEGYDEMSGIIEEVWLEDGNGAMISYLNHGIGSYGPSFKNATIKEVAESKMIPSYPAGTDIDCSNLGRFVVALASEGEEYDIFGSYAVIPEANLGDFETYGNSLSFFYPEHGYMFVSYAPKYEGYTEQEINEIVAIMSSFRVEN